MRALTLGLELLASERVCVINSFELIQSSIFLGTKLGSSSSANVAPTARASKRILGTVVAFSPF